MWGVGKKPLNLEPSTYLSHSMETPASTRLDIKSSWHTWSILATVHGWMQQPLGDLPTVPLNHSKLSQLQLLWRLRLSGQRSLQIKKYKLWVSVLTLFSLWPKASFRARLICPGGFPESCIIKMIEMQTMSTDTSFERGKQEDSTLFIKNSQTYL